MLSRQEIDSASKNVSPCKLHNTLGHIYQINSVYNIQSSCGMCHCGSIHPDTVWPNDPNVSLARHETRHSLLSPINNPLQEAIIIKNTPNKYSKPDQLPSL